MLVPPSSLRAKLGDMVGGFTNETALPRPHTRDSKWVFAMRSFGGFVWTIGCFLALERALLSLLLAWVLRRRGLFNQFRVFCFESLASISLSFAHHIV